MFKSYKLIIATTLSLLIVTVMYFGSYLPLRKSQLFIKAMSDLQSGKIRSIQDFDTAFASALNFYSPIGQDEISSQYLNILANVISQQTDKNIIEILTKQAENTMEPILKAGKGFGYSQNLYAFARLYELAAQKLNSNVYLQKSVDMLKLGLENSSNRFIFLEGLFNIYQMAGDKEKTKEIGEIILKYWPDNEKIKTIIQSL
ncbi:MAG: hypothetical protein Q8N22_01245 [bacterium]|nr:hypothetical protein [bacterium]